MVVAVLSLFIPSLGRGLLLFRGRNGSDDRTFPGDVGEAVAVQSADELPSLSSLIASATSQVTIAGLHFAELVQRENVDLEYFVRRGGQVRLILEDATSDDTPSSFARKEYIRRLMMEISRRGDLSIRFTLDRIALSFVIVDSEILFMAVPDSAGSSVGVPPVYLTTSGVNSPLMMTFKHHFDELWVRASSTMDRDY